MKATLEAMGFAVSRRENNLVFSGVNPETQEYLTGSYNGTALVTSAGKGLDVNSVKKSYAAQVVFKEFGAIGKITKMSASTFRVTLKV